MTTRPPAEIGMTLEEVDTPALLVDLDAFERNLRRLPERIAGRPVRLRPHAKTHKCPVIALKQVELGAVGVCVQKVGEAEAMVYGGVRDVLVSNEIVGAQKLRRLASLARFARVGVCADDAGQIEALEHAAAEAGARLAVYVEVDVGAGRCGVAPGEPALALARAVADKPHLDFAGLQAYQGSAQHLRRWEERRQAIAEAARHAARTRELLETSGIPCPIVTGAGTGSFEFEAASGVYGELQCGSYIFMDADYARNLDRDGSPVSTFEPALFVWSTVMSRPAPDRAVLDAGLKALAFDSGPPAVFGESEVLYERASDEHGKLLVKAPTNRFAIGAKVKLIPGHCDPTVNLYDWYVGIRGERVEAIWPIAARGAMT
jgi:D-serine deaminase-like pyridoxal phosphate-dependent protein